MPKKRRKAGKCSQKGDCTGCDRYVPIMQITQQWCSSCCGWVSRMATKLREGGVAAINDYHLHHVIIPTNRMNYLWEGNVVQRRLDDRIHREKAAERKRRAETRQRRKRKATGAA